MAWAIDSSSVLMFQSTPPVAGERSQSRPAPRHRRTCFNPRPPLPGSEAVTSIEATKFVEGFNPRPPLPGSEASLLAQIQPKR